MDLYAEYGITSFNFGHSSEFTPQSYYLIQEAAERIRPKVIILECFHANFDDKIYSPEKAHAMMDIMPFSYLKWQAARDLTDDKNIQLEFMFPIGKYHGRWKELSKEDFDKMDADLGITKGFVQYFQIFNEEVDKDTINPGIEDRPSVCEEYLSRIIAYCNGKNIDLVLVYAPYPYSEVEASQIGSYLDTLNDKDFVYLDMSNRSEFNYVTDLENGNHLNYSGALKYTRIIGDYLSENYNLVDYRGNCPVWDADVEKFIDYKAEEIKEQDDLYTELMLLCDDDFYGELYIDKSTLEDDALLRALIDNAYDVKIIENGSDDIFVNIYNRATDEKITF